MVVGNQPSTSCTSDIMAEARFGEQMKCRIGHLSSFELGRSRGVIRIRGVVYSNLALRISSVVECTSVSVLHTFDSLPCKS